MVEKKWVKSVFITFVTLFILSYVIVTRRLFQIIEENVPEVAEVKLSGILDGVFQTVLGSTLIGSLIVGLVLGTIIYFVFIKKKNNQKL